MQENTAQYWESFKVINSGRRAVRDFESGPIPDRDIEDILKEALLAPSSANVQPYQIHWIKDAEIKAKIAIACNNQRAATGASSLFVFVSSTQIAKKTLKDYAAHVEQSALQTEKSKSYWRKGFKVLNMMFKFGTLVIWTPVVGFFSWFIPSLALLPFGSLGIKHWTARNSIFAAQNLMLAAVAKGYDTCPMEGFNAPKIASILNLPYGSVVPVVVAFGKKSTDAPIDPQWRRPFEDAVVIH